MISSKDLPPKKKVKKKLYSFSFTQGKQDWNGWGECEGLHQKSIGHKAQGGLYSSCLQGQEYTWHQEFDYLKPGRYKVSAWLRAFEVEKGKWDDSIWLFYDVGKGTKFVVRNLKGSFQWSKIEYTIDVQKGKAVNIWFRLKSTGQLWIDDIRFEPWKGKVIKYRFQRSKKPFPKASQIGQGLRCQSCYRWWKQKPKTCPVCGSSTKHQQLQQQNNIQKPEIKVLADFESSQTSKEHRRHSLRSYQHKARSGKRSAVIRFAKYNNFSMNNRWMKDWSGYDYLAMEVYNPLQLRVPFSVCINDKQQSGYWDQLNHTTSLAPGWNQLRFSLKQYVGERGSVRIFRYLNLKKLKQFWFAVAPEDKRSFRQPFLVDSIRLLKAPPPPKSFEGLHRFDFIKETFRAQKGFIGIQPRHRYSKEVGFGFQKTSFWRSIDSLYADTLRRDAVLAKTGTFRVDLPNGEYEIYLVADHLGLWYEHFWSKKQIWIQEKEVLSQDRNSAADYLQNFLRFENTEPKPQDNPFDLYLQKIFKPIQTTAKVSNGYLTIRFSGTDSAIALNALLIYPSSKKKQGQQYIKQLMAVLRDEFSQISRKLIPIPKQESGAIQAKHRQKGFYTALISPTSYPRYNTILRSQGKEIQLEGGAGQRPVQAFLIRNLKKKALLTVKISSLKGSKGSRITDKNISVRYAVQQFMSHQNNHETYELAPRFLFTFPSKGKELPKAQSLLLWYQIALHKGIRAGKYKGEITFSIHGHKQSYPITLQVHSFDLPPVDMPIGFLGLDPVKFSYYEGSQVDKRKWDYQKKALRELQKRGFSTWSSLPKATLKKEGQVWTLDTSKVDRLMKFARTLGFKKAIFSYGENFLDPLLKLGQHDEIDGLSQEDYRIKTAKLLSQAMRKGNWLTIVHSFSDEAAGYSQKVEQDQKQAELLKKHYPFLRRGGFTHPIPPGKSGHLLNLVMTDVSLSSYTRQHIQKIIQKGHRWGLYNASLEPFTIGRSTFGKALYTARKNGASHRLEWHLSLAQNYPYYDLDGRENDAIMLYPRQNGQLAAALKLEWATLGLEDYRLLLLLEKLSKRSNKNSKAKVFLKKYKKQAEFFKSKNYLRSYEQKHTGQSQKSWRRSIYKMIFSLSQK